ncbi:MAG: hypothetical protein AAFO69_04795 [Bacteroidota bacterium]
MTLQEFFDFLSNRPFWILAYFVAVPVMAMVVNRMSGPKGLEKPWDITYSVLVFVVAIPGLLAVAFNVYLFLFERRSIFDTNIMTQLLPIASFIATLMVIRKNVALEQIPGFGKVSSLIIMIFGALAVMWVLDRTRIFFVAFTFMPFQYVIGIFIIVLVLLRYGFKKLFR